MKSEPLNEVFTPQRREMKLTELDKDLLELLALQVPWYMVCGEFHERYGSPGALARRLFALRDAELVSIRVKESTEAKLSPEALEADALSNECYDNLEATREPIWYMVSTDRGYELVKDRLGAQ